MSETPVTQEVEPNNRFSQANLIAAGTVAGTIDPKGDHDWLRYVADTPGALHILVTSVAQEMNYAVQVWTANKDVLANWATAPRNGADTEVTVDLPKAGTYHLELAHNGDGAAPAQPYQLSTTFTPTDDVFGPNNSFADAAPLTPGMPQSAFLFPKGEHDWFKVAVDTPGALHLVVTSVADNMNYALQAWTADKDVLMNWVTAPRNGADTDATIDLPKAGTYYLELAQNGDGADSTQAYQLQTTFAPTDDAFGSNNSFADAAQLKLDVPEQAFIFPKGEHDWFSFQAPGRSQAHILITNVPADLQPAFQVWTGSKDVLANWQVAPRAGADGEATVDLPKGGTYYLEVAHNGDGARSTQPYTAQVSVTPGVDADQYNNSFATARPIGLGADVAGSIVPRGYHGWYRVDVPGPGTLNVTVSHNPATLTMAAQVWNMDKDTVCSWQGAPRAGADVQFTCPVNEPGSYFIEVAQNGDGLSSPDAYHLTAVWSKPS